MAFAGRHGISRVQVLLDDESTWHEAEIEPPLPKRAWVLWRYDWKPARQGEYTIAFRAVSTGPARSGNPLLSWEDFLAHSRMPREGSGVRVRQ